MSYTTITQEEKKNQYDDNGVYDAAMGQLQSVKDGLPEYTSVHDKALQDLYKQITERPKFSYSAADDALYQSYKQSYTQQGRMAMEDTMGVAASLTGGYGSTYGQSVGNQQYNAYLQKLGEVYPETYGLAYQQYLDEGNALLDQYNLLYKQEQEAYDRYKDQMDAYYHQLGVQQDAYDRLAEMILTMGYTPTAEELQAAGMSNEHLQAYLGYYQNQQKKGGSGGSKDVTKTKDYKNNMYSALTALEEGKTVEEVNHDILNLVKSGKLDAETAGAIMAAITKEGYK